MKEFFNTAFLQIRNHLKLSWYLYLMTLIFFFVTYIVCQCSWNTIKRVERQLSSPDTTQQYICIDIFFPDSIAKNDFDSLADRQKSIGENSKETQSTSTAKHTNESLRK